MKNFWKGIVVCVLCLPMTVRAEEPMVTHIVDNSVKTLLVRRMGTAASSLEAERQQATGDWQQETEGEVEISFDQLSHDFHFYSYRVTHLNANYTPSDLMSSEYLEGYTTADITDYDHSLNTNVNYTHYRFTFPNEDMRITRPGLYAITIYEDNDPEKVVAVAVVEATGDRLLATGNRQLATGGVTVTGKVTANTIREFNGRYQQLDLELKIDPSTRSEDYFIVVRQNNRLDNMVFRPQPSFREANRLRWVNNPQLVFEGGNEYRRFDIYSTYYAGTGVDKVRYGQGDYFVTLDFDNSRTKGVYTHAFDVNGARVINAERCEDPDYEGEYMIVHFEYPAKGGECAPEGLACARRASVECGMYVGGELFYNRLTEENRMLYDAEAECYWLDALVKQGGTDYQYWYVTPGPVVSLEPTEGSYWQTENEYEIYVYYRPFGARCDELVTIEKIKSR